MKRLGEHISTPPEWNACLSQVILLQFVTFPQQLTDTPGWTGTVRVECLAKEYNTVSLARVQTRTTHSRDGDTNHEATVGTL